MPKSARPLLPRPLFSVVPAVPPPREEGAPPKPHRGSLGSAISHALDGLIETAAQERSFRLQVAVGTAVAAFGALQALSFGEQVSLLACIALVLFAELLNTAVEAVVDLASPGLHPLARRAKDSAAAAVAVMAVASLGVATALLHSRFAQVLEGGAAPRRLLLHVGLAALAALCSLGLMAGRRWRPAARLSVGLLGAVALAAVALMSASPVMAAAAAALFALAAAAARRG